MTRSVSPFCIPAGIWTFTVRVSRTTPAPLQVLHFSFGILPLPLHTSQVAVVAILPSIVRCTWRIDPLPSQFLQVSKPVPGFAPSPLQVLHAKGFVIDISFSVPKTLSLKVRLMVVCKSLPRRTWFLREPPPNISPKISPMSNSKPWPEPPCENPEKSKPPKPCPPPKPPCGPADPYWSYCARF